MDSPLIIDVFLEEIFPGEFKKLQNETRQLLENLMPIILILFSICQSDRKRRERVTTMKNFTIKGMLPINVTLEEKENKRKVVFHGHAKLW